MDQTLNSGCHDGDNATQFDDDNYEDDVEEIEEIQTNDEENADDPKSHPTKQRSIYLLSFHFESLKYITEK